MPYLYRPVIDNGNVILTWTAPADHGSPITDYDVSYMRVRDGVWTEWKPDETSTATTATITGLTGVLYHFDVRAENARGPGYTSNVVVGRLDLEDPPFSPASVTVTRGSDSLIVTWTSVYNATSYSVVYSDDHKSTWQDAHTGVTGTSVTITGASANLDYYVAVRAVNRWGESGWTNSAISSAPSPPPAAPSGVTLTRTTGSLNVSWSAVSAATGYNVVYTSDHKQSWTRAHTGISGTSATISVDDSLDYYVAVQAVNANGRGHWTDSAIILALTPPPAAPSGVTVTRTSGTLSVSWTAVSGATGYNVVYTSDHKQSWTRAHTGISGTSATISVGRQQAVLRRSPGHQRQRLQPLDQLRPRPHQPLSPLPFRSPLPEETCAYIPTEVAPAQAGARGAYLLALPPPARGRLSSRGGDFCLVRDPSP